MGIVEDLLPLMPSVVTLEPYLGHNAYNDFTFGPPVAWRSRIEMQRRRVGRTDGEDVFSSGTVMIAGIPHASTRDRLTLPDGSQPNVIAVESITDETGPICERLVLGA